MGAGRDRVAGDAGEKAGECDPPFQPCEGQADADMRATRKGQMAVGFARDVKDIRVGELLWVPIGCPDTEVQICALRDENTIYFSVLRRFSIAELVGRGHAQDLFHGCDHQCGRLAQHSLRMRVMVQQGQPVTDQVCRGFVARVQDENAVLDQLDFAKLAVAVACDQAGQNVGFRVTGMGATVRDKLLKIRLEFRNRVVSGGHLFGRQNRLQSAQNGKRPTAQGASVLQGNIEQVSNDLDRDLGGKIFNKIRVFGQSVEQVIDRLDQSRFQPLDGARGQGAGHDASDTGVERRIVEDQRGCVMLEKGTVCAEFWFENNTFVGGEKVCVLVDMGQIRVA